MGIRIAALGLVIVLGATVSAGPSVGEENPGADKEMLSRRLLEATGAGEMGRQMLAQLIETFRVAHPELPQEFWGEFLEQATDLEELVVPVYVEHLSIEELEAAIAFYESEVGRSMMAKMPVILQESMALGEQWGEALARDIMERIAEKQSAPAGT